MIKNNDNKPDMTIDAETMEVGDVVYTKGNRKILDIGLVKEVTPLRIYGRSNRYDAACIAHEYGKVDSCSWYNSGVNVNPGNWRELTFDKTTEDICNELGISYEVEPEVIQYNIGDIVYTKYNDKVDVGIVKNVSPLEVYGPDGVLEAYSWTKAEINMSFKKWTALTADEDMESICKKLDIPYPKARTEIDDMRDFLLENQISYETFMRSVNFFASIPIELREYVHSAYLRGEFSNIRI